MKPVTKEKTIALDGVEFTVYTQRFKNDETIYVGCQTKTIDTKPALYRNFNAHWMVSEKSEATV